MEKELYTGKVLRVTEEEIGDVNYERVYLHENVIVIPFTDQGRIIFVLEKRPHEDPPERIKLVTGFYEQGFTPEENANRELREEIGKKAGTLIPYITCVRTGMVNERKHYVIARDLEDSKLPNPDGEDTILEVREYDIDRVYGMLMQGKPRIDTTAYVLLRLCLELKSGSIPSAQAGATGQ